MLHPLRRGTRGCFYGLFRACSSSLQGCGREVPRLSGVPCFEYGFRERCSPASALFPEPERDGDVAPVDEAIPIHAR